MTRGNTKDYETKFWVFHPSESSDESMMFTNNTVFSSFVSQLGDIRWTSPVNFTWKSHEYVIDITLIEECN